MPKLHEYGVLLGQALPGKFRGYKTPGEKLRPRYPHEYGMAGVKNRRDLRKFDGGCAAYHGMPSPTRKTPQRFEKLAMNFYDNPRYDPKAFKALPKPARRILNMIWAAEASYEEDQAYGRYY